MQNLILQQNLSRLFKKRDKSGDRLKKAKTPEPLSSGDRLQPPGRSGPATNLARTNPQVRVSTVSKKAEIFLDS